MYKEKWTDGQPQTAEYYLMDASGHTLALRKTDLVQNTHNWEYYVYGNEREARLTPSEGQSPGNNSTNTAKRIVETNVQFYLYDHLGNTRVTYSPRVADVPNQSFYNNIDYVIDYFPYGKMLREFVPDVPERYLTTQHERDKETGLDYRGARYYDSDVARFLSIDPWADKYPAWSTYNYVMGNPVILIDPTGKGADDWVKNIETGEYIWDNTVTNQYQAHEGQRYIGKEDSDIIKDLFGQTIFTLETWDVGVTGMTSGRGYVASSKAKVFTTLNVSIRANVTHDGDNKTFNGIDFFVSSEGTTNAPLTPDKKMAFTATDVKFQGVDMKPLPEPDGPVIKAPVGSGTFTYFWSAQRVYNDFGKSYNRTISLQGQYTFGGVLFMDYISGVVPNSTKVSLTVPFNNK